MITKKEIKKLALGIITAPVFYVALFIALLLVGTAFVKMTEQEDLGGEYVLSYDTNDIWDNRLGREAIGAYIDAWTYDDSFILAFRWAEGNPDRDGIIADEKKPQFWIIDKISRSVYGPVDMNGYLEKRDSLGVPEDLKLKLDMEI